MLRAWRDMATMGMSTRGITVRPLPCSRTHSR